MEPDIEKKVDQMATDIHDIKKYLYNDVNTNQKGLVQQTRENTMEIANIKKQMAISTGKKSVWILVISGVGTGLTLLGEFILKHFF